MTIRKNKQNGVTISLDESETIIYFRETYFMFYETLLKAINENIRFLYRDIADKANAQRNEEENDNKRAS